MELKQVNFNTFDVFIGKGWDFWGRFKVAHKQDGTHIFQINGTKYPQTEVTKLREYFNNYHNY